MLVYYSKILHQSMGNHSRLLWLITGQLEIMATTSVWSTVPICRGPGNLPCCPNPLIDQLSASGVVRCTDLYQLCPSRWQALAATGQSNVESNQEKIQFSVLIKDIEHCLSKSIPLLLALTWFDISSSKGFDRMGISTEGPGWSSRNPWLMIGFLGMACGETLKREYWSCVAGLIQTLRRLL